MYVNQFEFLGFVISEGNIRQNPNKVKAILAITAPKNRKKLQAFLGMINYYRKFLPKISEMTKPLNKLTSVNVQFDFTEECNLAFNKIKDALARDVMLRIPVFGERFYISCDASNVAIGAVLAQSKPPDDKPDQFFSKSLNAQQQRWTAMERECLALVTAVKEFSPYLQGRELIHIDSLTFRSEKKIQSEALANKFGKAVLTTCNKFFAAQGTTDTTIGFGKRKYSIR